MAKITPKPKANDENYVRVHVLLSKSLLERCNELRWTKRLRSLSAAIEMAAENGLSK